MPRYTVYCLLVLIIIAFCGCSTINGVESPIAPVLDNSAAQQSPDVNTSPTYLWGYYDVYLNMETMSAEIVPNRNLDFTVNIVKFLDKTASGLAIQFNGTHAGSGYVDVDLDVTIKHPFPNKPEYNGYDVRGIFIGDGTQTLAYDSALKYAGTGDQQMHDFNELASDPHTGEIGNPDGYTRWWNPTEFITPGIFGYYH